MFKGVQLTEEQQRIVAHGHGSALVFAVAGAGKTTTLVHRIDRLIREEVFAPERMLVSSFSRASVNDIKEALKRFPGSSRVQVKTLHGLAYSIVREALKLGLVKDVKLPEDVETVEFGILIEAFKAARAKGLDFARELDNLDREDFFAYVGACKAQLAFADLIGESLPAGNIATQASAPKHIRWYLPLYKLYEGERRRMGVLTFDDLVPHAWVLLAKYPDFKQRYQNLYDCVMVDEFQDMNRAQVELLDLLVEQHRNYFVVGDDDQCLFSWRGASNEFILGFEKRYGAPRYTIKNRG